MDGILSWGLGPVLWLQRYSPDLDPLFTLLSFLGGQAWLMLLLPLLLWCGDQAFARRLTLLFLLSVLVNAAAKDLIGWPRPFDFSPAVLRLENAASGGMPSGHVQNAVVVYGSLAWRLRRGWGWVAAGSLTAGIAVSRLYLGAHFPTDLVGGALLGGVLLAAFVRFSTPAATRFERLPLALRLALALILPLLPVPFYAEWDGAGPAAGAALAGLGTGFLVERRCVGFDSGGGAARRLARFVLGALCLFGLDLGLKLAFAGVGPPAFWRALRHFLLGAWVGLGAPALFVRLGLAAGPSPDLVQAKGAVRP